MSQEYNPIVRMFGELRAVLVSSLDVARHEVRPSAELEALIPVRKRREVWRRLRRQGVRVPGLQLRGWEASLRALAVLKTTLWLALWLRQWPAVLIAFPLGLWEYWSSRPRAVHSPLGLRTVGELVLYMTSFREHKRSGYRWTHNEIAMKVRLVIAESLGLPLDAVRAETTLSELVD